jgi:hypothetical protein
MSIDWRRLDRQAEEDGYVELEEEMMGLAQEAFNPLERFDAKQLAEMLGTRKIGKVQDRLINLWENGDLGMVGIKHIQFKATIKAGNEVTHQFWLLPGGIGTSAAKN